MALAQPALPRLALLPPAPTELAPPVPPRRALLPPAPTELARMVHPRPGLPLPAPTELAPLVPPRLALLPPAHPRPAQVRMALLPPVHPQLAPTVLAHPVRLLPPELPRAARMVRLLATAPLAAPPLLPRATTAWVNTSLRVNPFPRGSLLIRTSRLPARAAISSPPRTRPIRTVAVTRRTWIIWTSSPVIQTRFPTVSTVRSTPQVVLTAAAPTELRRVTPSNRNPLLRATECLRSDPTGCPTR